MQDDFCKHLLTFFIKTKKQDASDQDNCQNQKKGRITGDNIAGIQKPAGKSVHFHSHLLEYLPEDRKYFDKKDNNNDSHHDEHEKRIGDCASNLPGCFLFLFIVPGKAVQNFVKTTGLFAGFYISSHGIRKKS